MLRFSLFENGQPAQRAELAGAYLFGSDAVPVRAELEFADGVLTCNKRTAGPVGLAIVWPVEGFGRILLDTTRLQERDRSYVLSLELARGQLMRMAHKFEEWGVFDSPDAASHNARLREATDLLIDGLQCDDPAEASRIGDKILSISVCTAEELSRVHAKILLERRKESAGFPRHVLGCFVNLATPVETAGPIIRDTFEFATLPIRWKQIEPTEQTYQWKPLDAWVDWLVQHRIPIKGSSLVCFQEQNVPDWLYIWEHDFDTVRELVSEHVRRVIRRYGSYIQAWDVISGIHANSSFSFNFEQLMELTRTVATLTKKLAPRSVSVVDISVPWGEYYARNQRTIPPMLYAEMAFQSGITFDAIGVQFCFGVESDGMFVRDMFQISSLLDRFGNFGKPIHVTAVQVPSNTSVDKADAWGGSLGIESAGQWHGKWSEAVQSQWLRQFYEIALSKPFVDTVSWRDLSDHQPHYLPHGGLLNPDQSRKAAFNELVSLRGEILPDSGAR